MRFIPTSTERQNLDDALQKAYEAIYLRRGTALYECVSDLPGLKLVERSDFSYHKRCYWYVFREEAWFRRLDEFEQGRRLMNDVTNTLSAHSFIEISTPERGCVLVYQHNPSEPKYASHFGKYNEGTVISKFGMGHIYEHAPENVPHMFGNYIRYFKKTKSRRRKA